MASTDSKCKFYNIKFYEDRIKTIVTSDAHTVDRWIDQTYYVQGDNFLVGLDTEWQWDHETRDYEVAVLQLCVGRHCLIYQLSHSETTPQSLTYFLSDENVTFVAKEVREDVTRLARQGLHVSCAMDVGHMAEKKYKDKSFKSKGLKTLAMEFLNKEMEKDKKITRSRWGNERLSRLQVEYACIDAFVSFQLGMQLQMPYLSEERMELFAETKEGKNNSNRKNKNHIIQEEAIAIGDYSRIIPTGWF